MDKHDEAALEQLGHTLSRAWDKKQDLEKELASEAARMFAPIAEYLSRLHEVLSTKLGDAEVLGANKFEANAKDRSATCMYDFGFGSKQERRLEFRMKANTVHLDGTSYDLPEEASLLKDAIRKAALDYFSPEK